jgi:hypothetical protein
LGGGFEASRGLRGLARTGGEVLGVGDLEGLGDLGGLRARSRGPGRGAAAFSIPGPHLAVLRVVTVAKAVQGKAYGGGNWGLRVYLKRGG